MCHYPNVGLISAATEESAEGVDFSNFSTPGKDYIVTDGNSEKDWICYW